MIGIDRKSDALIVVDVQNDFCPGGALAVRGGDAIIPVINGLLAFFDVRIYSRDWHPSEHFSFNDSPKYVDGSWPVHCVAGSNGAKFHPDLVIPDDAFIISKGTCIDKEAYSVFDETGLDKLLKQRGIKRLFIAGMATDYCVRWTALDAVRFGFEAIVVVDAVRGVDVPPGSVDKSMDEILRAGVSVIASDVISH